MHNKLIIIGASGHGKVCADIALKLQKYDEILFLDDDENIKECLGFPVIGKSTDAEQYISSAEFFVAIGDSKARMQIQTWLMEHDAAIAMLVHPTAVIGENVSIGEGTAIMAGCVVNPYTVIGQGCIVNTCASIDHDGCIGNYVHVSVGAHLCGTVWVGKHTWIGAGVTINNNVSICDSCMIGTGAVVIKDIKEAGTYIGVPVRKII